jgi:hypothetical protein
LEETKLMKKRCSSRQDSDSEQRAKVKRRDISITKRGSLIGSRLNESNLSSQNDLKDDELML